MKLHTSLAVLASAFTVAGMGAVAEAAVKVTGDLPRMADLAFRTQSADGTVAVRGLEAGSPAAKAGLKDGDVIKAIDGRAPENARTAEDLLRRLDGGKPVRLSVTRQGKPVEVRFTPTAAPWEAIAGLDYEYGVIDMPDGARLRTIITRPAGATGDLPALFFVQWVSCDPVTFEGAAAYEETYRRLMQQSGMAMIRVERSSAGDSEGPACDQEDWETELAHYRFAYERLVNSPGIDPAKIIVVGNSLGSFMAPFVAEGRPVAGVMISGGGGLTHFERMLWFDRANLERAEGKDPSAIDREMRRHTRYLTYYLLHGQTPAEISRIYPDIADVWGQMLGTEDGAHYGRPYAYHQQAAARDPLATWLKIKAPVLVVYNEYDQFESRHGHEVIARIRNRAMPGSTTFVQIPQASHGFTLHADVDRAYFREAGANGAPLAAGAMLNWLADLKKGW